MTSDSAKGIVFVTGGVIVGVTLLEYSNVFIKAGSKGQSVGSAAGTIAGGTGKAFKQLWAVVLAMIVLAFIADQVPQVAGPVALLILVSYIYKKEPEIVAGYKSAQS